MMDLPPNTTRQAYWRRQNPEKYEAHKAVANALNRGLLKKGKCVVCGSLRVDAHHDDYSKPLQVTWLCRRHHREAHVKMRAAQ
jgi:hypothetical protein